MDYQSVLLSARMLPASDRAKLISELLGHTQEDYLSVRCRELYDKQANCPWCNSKHYRKYGKDKGCQRFKCNDCLRTFTEYSGTWLDGLHKKPDVVEYIKFMLEGKSLDRISKEMGMSKKTAFDWRHKILSSLCQDRGDQMSGIIESDETFFAGSDKGSRHLNRPGRKRGCSTSLNDKKKRGISSDLAAVIVTADRQGRMNLSVPTMGRIGKDDIACCIAYPPADKAILCTDGHVSFKGFAIDNKLKHVILRADLKQHVKHGVYHIQNVNSIHNRMKKWIDNTFWGVSTKYLQNYLGWFRLNELLKGSTSLLNDFFVATMQDTDTLKRYNYINVSYQWLLATQK